MTVIRREAPWIFHHCQSSIIVWSQECPIAQNWSPELMNLNWTMNWRGILLKIFPLTSHKPKSFFYFGIFHCTADSMEWTPAQYVTWKEVSTQMSSSKFKMNQRACLTNKTNIFGILNFKNGPIQLGLLLELDNAKKWFFMEGVLQILGPFFDSGWSWWHNHGMLITSNADNIKCLR